MSASAIARVVEDVRLGRVRSPGPSWPNAVGRMRDGLNPIPVIDATEMYKSLTRKEGSVWLYEDHECIAPPWETFFLCYLNEHGNVIVMLCSVDDYDHWETDKPLNWDDVKWKVGTLIFIGGKSIETGPFQTTGPLHSWQYAIDGTGKPLDLHWTHIVPDYPMGYWDTAQLVLLGALNFLNCRNVQIIEPKRDRAERRRIERTGQRVYTINVFPTGKQTAAQRSQDGGVPLTSVRGHFAAYGPEYGKGLLFGKYSGRYWIPQFARGSKEYGEVSHDYRLRPDTEVSRE